MGSAHYYPVLRTEARVLSGGNGATGGLSLGSQREEFAHPTLEKGAGGAHAALRFYGQLFRDPGGAGLGYLGARIRTARTGPIAAQGWNFER